jgi:hypothetical protein
MSEVPQGKAFSSEQGAPFMTSGGLVAPHAVFFAAV